ncbi:hypothetical protein V2W45_1467865 [Cenococcum geophilum]
MLSAAINSVAICHIEASTANQFSSYDGNLMLSRGSPAPSLRHLLSYTENYTEILQQSPSKGQDKAELDNICGRDNVIEERTKDVSLIRCNPKPQTKPTKTLNVAITRSGRTTSERLRSKRNSSDNFNRLWLLTRLFFAESISTVILSSSNTVSANIESLD